MTGDIVATLLAQEDVSISFIWVPLTRIGERKWNFKPQKENEPLRISFYIIISPPLCFTSTTIYQILYQIGYLHIFV